MKVTMRINQGLNLLQGNAISENHQGKSSDLGIRPYSLVIVIYAIISVIKLEIVVHITITCQFVAMTLDEFMGLFTIREHV